MNHIVRHTIAGSGRNAWNLINAANGMMALDIVSPNLRQLEEVHHTAQARGWPITTRHGRIEEEMSATRGAVLLTLDSPRAISQAVQTSIDARRDVVPYLMIQPYRGPLIAIAGWLDDAAVGLKRQFAAFMLRLGQVTAASGSAALFGSTAPPSNLLIEPVLRQWMARHATETTAKLAHRLDPNDAPLTASIDGSPMRFAMVDSPSWRSAEDLAVAVIEQLEAPLVPGERFLIGETGPTGVRLHQARLRPTDRRVAINGTSTVDEESVAAAVRDAIRAELHRLRPVVVSD